MHETLTAWSLRHLADDVVLVVGELLANAITHGGPPVGLRLRASMSGPGTSDPSTGNLSASDPGTGMDELSVEVTDHGPGRPRRLDLDLEAVHGRGMTIVEALAHACGVTPLPHGPGKTVWARWWLPSHGV